MRRKLSCCLLLVILTVLLFVGTLVVLGEQVEEVHRSLITPTSGQMLPVHFPYTLWVEVVPGRVFGMVTVPSSDCLLMQPGIQVNQEQFVLVV